MVTDNWDGTTERRAEYCPVHHIKCQEIREAKEGMKSRVPIWVGKLFLTCLVLVLGYMNLDAYRRHKLVVESLNTHIEDSTRVLTSISHGVNEVALNQRRVMRQIELEFQELPHYESD